MSHISYSALKNWAECSYKHKIMYVDGVKEFKGNTYTIFGTALHSTCEKLVTDTSSFDVERYFLECFRDEKNKLDELGVEVNSKLMLEMIDQGRRLSKLALPALKKCFKNFEVVSAEEKLFEPIETEEYDFKGFIDLVVKTPDGKYHIIDWKTCSWGWDSKKKSDRMITYQLTLYKHFYAKKHNIDPSDIETHFALLKRTAKKNEVEIFRVTSGKKKTDNALNLLNKALYNIKKERFIKNRLSCGRCEFFKTEYCT
jgi:hypothetical protein